ncbi:GAF domain-containing protein [candidate division TA06 bacterium]|nr:GAF domain-containing protein [candidate division TA06 bacterium]
MTKKCWEEVLCTREDCPVKQNQEDYCWLSQARVCIDGQNRDIRERLHQCCRDCPHFQKTLERSTGRRLTDQVMAETVLKLLEEMGGVHAELTASNRQLGQKMRELAILNEATKALQTTLDLDQVLHIILTGVTAAQALSLNRAFLLLVDGDRRSLTGKMAVGPGGAEEAFNIWNELQKSPRSFREMALTPYSQVKGNLQVNQLVKKLSAPLSDRNNILIQVLGSKKPLLVTDAASFPGAQELVGLLKVNSFIAAPLVAEQEALGIILADNAVTKMPIHSDDVTLLEIFAGQVSAFIRNAGLYQNLKDKVKELQHSQEKLLKAERMAAVGEMAAVLAHEIRTPMVSIGGFVNSMIRETPDDPRFGQQLKIISSEIDRLEGVLTDTLELSRFKEPELVSENINDVVKRCIGVLKAEFDRQNIDVVVSLEEGLEPVWIDRHQFPQVLMNILKNALHAMPLGGQLSARTFLDIQKEMVISISDTGSGIPHQALEHVFEPKFTTKRGGLGIGLAVSKKIVESHRGSISVSSAEGRGTSFVIRLPSGQQTAE